MGMSQQFYKSDLVRNLFVEKLRESEEGFRTLSESMPMFIGIAGADLLTFTPPLQH